MGRKHGNRFIGIIFISVISIAVLGMLTFDAAGNMPTDLPPISCTARTEDRVVELSWDYGNWKNLSYTKLTIADGRQEKILEINKWKTLYQFSDGEHGKMYTFTIEPVYRDGTMVEPFTVSRMFLDYAQLPNLPLIEINTADGQEPTYTKLEPPKGYMGAAIDNNEYVDAVMNISYDDGFVIQDSIRYKIRGNTSAYDEVKPYRIQLSGPKDILRRTEDSENSDEWLLIPEGHNLKLLVGNYAAEICGTVWQPDLRYVNLIINGDWKGCYLLIEPVDENNEKYQLTDTGFLIENDGYWWKEDEVYFKSEHMYYNMEYTVKFPGYQNLTDTDLRRMKQYMDRVEDSIYLNGNYADYIDEDSFAAWILAHDVIGTEDGGGSNMFLYKNELSGDSVRTKLMMGPVWDLDSIHRTKDRWSSIHDSELFYYKKLFEYEEFKKVYIDLWNEVGQTLYEDVERFLKEYMGIFGQALQESWDLHAERWDKEIWTVDMQRDNALDWYKDRVEWLNENVK